MENYIDKQPGEWSLVFLWVGDGSLLSRSLLQSRGGILSVDVVQVRVMFCVWREYFVWMWNQAVPRTDM